MQMESPDSLVCPAYRKVKVFVWLWDVPVGGGATVVLPGTYLHSITRNCGSFTTYILQTHVYQSICVAVIANPEKLAKHRREKQEHIK